MNIQPPDKSGRLKDLLSERYQEFKDRRLIAIRQYGVHPLLPSLPHHAAGTKTGEKYVSLLDMLAFGREQGWTGMEQMEKGLTDCAHDQMIVPTADGGTVIHELEPKQRPKGERYTLVRMGALLEVLEQWVADDGRIPKSCIRAGELNFSALEILAESVIAQKALSNGKHSYSGFKKGVIRKEYSEAKKMLEDHFRL